VRALPDYRHVLFFNHNDGFNAELFETMTGLGAEVRAVLSYRRPT